MRIITSKTPELVIVSIMKYKVINNKKLGKYQFISFKWILEFSN